MVNLRSWCVTTCSAENPHEIVLFAISIWISKTFINNSMEFDWWRFNACYNTRCRCASLKMKCWQNCLLLNSSVFVYLTHWSFRVCIDKQLSLKSDIYTGTFNLYDTNWPIPFTNHNRTKWICATALIAISLLDTPQKLYESLLRFDDNENFVFFYFLVSIEFLWKFCLFVFCIVHFV